MNSEEICEHANIDNILGPGQDIKKLFWNFCVDEFMEECGETAWRRVLGTISLTANTNYVDVDNEVLTIKRITLAPDYEKPLNYLGEDLNAQLLSLDTSAAAAKPSGWWREFDTAESGGRFKRIKFNSTADQTYAGGILYYRTIPFINYETSVDIGTYVPREWQWGMVEKMKSIILRDRLGVNDSRYTVAFGAYQQMLAKLRRNPESANRQRRVYVD